MSNRAALIGFLTISLIACDDASDVRDGEFRAGKGHGHAYGHGHGHGHGQGNQTGLAQTFPNADWEVAAPEQHGLSSEGLEQMALVAEQTGSSCMMVIHDGVLVGEWYWDGFDRDTDVTNVFSVTKSITSTLTGIAQDRGLINIDDAASDYLPAWQGTDSEGVTVRNLLSNDSGRFWSFESDYVTGLAAQADQTAYAMGLAQQFEAGSVWEYNNSAIQNLSPILGEATGEDLGDFAQANLFGPIGASVTMGRDPAGNVQAYQGASASCDDMARFGYLALRGGRWQGQQIVSNEWMDAATSTSTNLNDAYGMLWWLNNNGHVVLPSFPTRNEFDGQLAPASAEDVFAAIGAFGQLVIVDPSDEYVVVRLFDVPDVNAQLAVDTDPVGATDLAMLLEAFESAKL